MVRYIFLYVVTLSLTMSAAVVQAYRLPPYEISGAAPDMPAEDVLKTVDAKRELLATKADLKRIDEHNRNTKIRLSRRELSAAKEYRDHKIESEFWNYVVALKTSLLKLHQRTDKDIDREADAMARNVIVTLYDLSQRWKVGSSAIFHNFLVSAGAKEKGFCYHYVDALRKALSKDSWNYFVVRWGAAWNDTVRENNGLVITAEGEPFEKGIVIDAWRTAGRPFWTPVKGDKYPWKELSNVVIP